ncbi:hypothetical protein [Streptomyces violascens]|uniref:Uncharacterized protein n=1 Tax=Streptomyces violascens TaxID=67381 RepID=A0ABQ3QR00_9ACTN|nr:hypothetical protein [Streptomyces violascens]GGU53179.1 hypothetical protein GCM10010289_86390 [Streptomyces violascens]GHI39700.1 hypothetical protein Sviol_41080 [Streptomyces violascens]
MPEQMTRDQASEIVHDCYTTGQPQSTAVALTGYSRSWVAAEYRRLKARGVSRVAGQLELFDPSSSG